MLQAYFQTVSRRLGNGWNRFWFTPRDPRSLSLLRVFVALTALYMVGLFSLDLVRLFGPQGMASREAVQLISVAQEQVRTGVGAQPIRFSYLDYLSTPTELWIGHMIGLCVVTLFALGLFTRVTSVLALAVVVSYIHSATWLTTPAEAMLALSMFYLCFADCGAYYSLDSFMARRRRVGPSIDPVPGVGTAIATRLLQTHLALVYAMIALGMLSFSDVWWNGYAVWYLAARTESNVVDMRWLSQTPLLIDFLTHLAVGLAIAYPLLIWNRLARPPLMLLSVPVWLMIGLITGLLPFAALMIALNLVFIPPEVLRRLITRSAPVADEREPIRVAATS